MVTIETVEVPVSVRELAEAFSMLASDEQAHFFAEVSRVMHEWVPIARDMQVHYMARDMAKLDGARWLIDELAGYAS